MATGHRKGCCWTLILFASLLPLVKVELNITSPEFSEADIEDNGDSVNEAMSLNELPNKDKTPNMMKNSGTDAQVGKNKTKSIIKETNREKVTKMNETNESHVNTELLTLLHSQKYNKTTENSLKPEVATVKNYSQKSNYSIADITLLPENLTPKENFLKELSTAENSSIQTDHIEHVNIFKKIDTKNDFDQYEHFVKPEELIHASTPLPLDIIEDGSDQHEHFVKPEELSTPLPLDIIEGGSDQHEHFVKPEELSMPLPLDIIEGGSDQHEHFVKPEELSTPLPLDIIEGGSDQHEHFVKPEELSTPLPLDDTEVSSKTSSNSNRIPNDITLYSITESPRMENHSNTLKLNSSKNLEYKRIPNSSVGTTEMVINSLTEEHLGNSEQWDSYNKIRPITSVVQSTTGIKEEYSTSYSTVYSSPLAKFILRSNFHEDPCIVAVMRIQISIQCDNTSNKVKSYKINVPENAYVSGSCDKPQIMTISWMDESNNTFALTLKSSLIVPGSESLEKGESVSITNISLKMKLDSKDFPGNLTLGDTFSASNLNLFKSPVNQIYLSRQTQLLKLEAHLPKICSVILTFSNVQFQAYIPPSHDKAIDSMLTNTSNSTMKVLFISVPVGLLGTLVVISFVIYMRKRLRPEHSFNV